MQKNKKILFMSGLVLLAGCIIVPYSTNAQSSSKIVSSLNTVSESKDNTTSGISTKIISNKNLWSIRDDSARFNYTWISVIERTGANIAWDFGEINEYPKEFQDAYDWAYENWIISEASINSANLYKALTNLELAEIMNKYSKNLLWRVPDTNKFCSFNDVNMLTWYERDTVIKTCQLGLMAYQTNSFEPGQKTNMAKFGTILSKALWGDEYEGGSPYYNNHLNALQAAWLINQISNPENTNVIKWYALNILKNTSEWNDVVNCEDPTIVLACLDPEADVYQDCPNACKPDGILTNNLTKTVEFKSNEVITRTVFDWSIKALKDISINDYTIDTMAMYQEGRDDTYFEQRCQKNKTNMTFYIYIDWKLVWSTYYEDACNLGQWAWFGHIFDNINIKKWQSKTVKVELEINGYVQEDDMYNFTLYFTDKNWNIPHYWAKSISAKLAPVKILARDNEFSIQTPSKQDTVYLKSKNSTLAEFTLKPSKWNSAYLNELSLDIDISLIKDDDITLLIDNTEQELTSLKNHTFTYQPDMEISSKWVNVKLILNQELEYDDYTVWTKIKSINWKSINKSFSKRFVSVLVYIAKQENRWDHTKFTLWVEKYDDNYFTNFVCLLTSTWTHAGTCFPGHSSWSYEDWYTFTVNNSVLDQNINFIRYQINSSVMSWWGDNITIEREDYPDYFKTKTWEPWKIYWSTPGETTYGNLTSWQVINAWYTTEMKEAYQFAKSNWITTIHDINKAKMNLPLTRIAMAKMLSNYAINVLWKSPDLSKWTPVFNDVTNKLNKQYDNAVTLSYQLWIMWQNMKNNNFRPYDEVTRAEFATALSRMLYNTEDWKWNVKYYEPHMAKLYSEWIINNTNAKMKEKRGYVMTMLMRTAE